MSYGSRSDEGEMRDARVGRQVICGVWPAGDRVDQIRGVTACSECSSDNICEEYGGPGCVFRVLDDDGVASKQTRDHGSDKIVERVVPAHTSSDDTEWLVMDHVGLVKHEEVRRS